MTSDLAINLSEQCESPSAISFVLPSVLLGVVTNSGDLPLTWPLPVQEGVLFQLKRWYFRGQKRDFGNEKRLIEEFFRQFTW